MTDEQTQSVEQTPAIKQLNKAVRDPHQPYPDMYLSEEQTEMGEEARMISEGGNLLQKEDVGGPVMTPRTQVGEEGYEDETVEGGGEKQVMVSGGNKDTSISGCNCNCTGHCPEDCPASCKCAGHTRNAPSYNVSGDEPYKEYFTLLQIPV